MFGIGLALGLGTCLGGIAGTLFSTGRDMYKDNLISEKEMAEIRAKENSFKKLIDHYNFKIQTSYDLEKEFLMGLRELTKDLLSMINIFIEKIDRADDTRKIDIYSDKIDNCLLLITTLQCRKPQYFTQEFLDSIQPSMIDYNNKTDIGINYKEDKEKLDFKKEIFKIATSKK